MTITKLRIAAGQGMIDCGASNDPLLVWTEDGSQRKITSSAASPLLVSILDALACTAPRSRSMPWWMGLTQSLDVEGLSLAQQAELVRDICHGPFRPIYFRAAWRAKNAGLIHGFAHAIYEQEAFDELPILGDVLEDVGCTDDDILSHLRGPGPHVRGCWPLDIVLGKG